MSVRLERFRTELRPMLRLAWPLVLAEIGWMAMGLVDTMMVGRLPDSAAAMGAVSLGSILFYTIGVSGSGLLLGLDTLVSQAFGAGDIKDTHRSLLNGVYLGLFMTPLLMAAVWLSIPFLDRFGIHPAVLRETVPYLNAINWSTLPLVMYFAFRRYLQSINVVAPITFALVSANLVNVAVNWLLIFGHLGAPALGAEGAGWATTISRGYMALVLLGYILYSGRGTGLLRMPLGPDLARIRRLFALGFPAAMQLCIEIGVFAVVTALIAKLDPASLAGHQIALLACSLTFMVPLGISSAAAVRVGQALGRGDLEGAERAGWTAMALGAAFMFCAALTLWLAPGAIARAFTPDPVVVRTGVSLLIVAAFFQLFDGMQIVATGALRGAGDTRTPMICHLMGYWVIGLPLGHFLCFAWGWGAAGLWIGLCIALVLIGIVLLAAWRGKVQAFFATAAAGAGLSA